MKRLPLLRYATCSSSLSGGKHTIRLKPLRSSMVYGQHGNASKSTTVMCDVLARFHFQTNIMSTNKILEKNQRVDLLLVEIFPVKEP